MYLFKGHLNIPRGFFNQVYSLGEIWRNSKKTCIFRSIHVDWSYGLLDSPQESEQAVMEISEYTLFNEKNWIRNTSD